MITQVLTADGRKRPGWTLLKVVDCRMLACRGREERGIHIIIERSMRLMVSVSWQEDLGVSTHKGKEERGIHTILECSMRLVASA